MVKKLKADARIGKYCTTDICDSGIGVRVADDITNEEYVAVKVDDFYNGLQLSNTPKMIDFAVTVDCVSSNYVLYLIEMKSAEFSNVEIEEKFANAINMYLEQEYKDIYCADCYKYKNIYLYLISKSPRAAISYESYADYIKVFNKINAKDSLAKDIYLSDKLFRFRNNILKIQREIPDVVLIKKEL